MHGASVPEIQALYALDDPIVKRVDHMDERTILNSDVIISVSNALTYYWHQKHPDALAMSYVIPCVVDTNKFSYSPFARKIKRNQWRVTDDVPVFVYLGSLAFYQKIDDILHVFSKIKSHFPRSKILILTAENNFPAIKTLAKKHGIDDDLILFSVSHDDVSAYLSACDVGFLLRDDLLLNNVSSPTKFGEYLACGVPVISSSCICDIKDIIAKYNVGMLFSEDMDKVIAFAQGVMRSRQEWANRCVSFVEQNYSWEVYASKLMAIYNDPALKR